MIWRLAEVEDVDNIGMTNSVYGLCLELEPFDHVLVAGVLLRKNFDRGFSPNDGMGRFVDQPHAPLGNEFIDLEMTELGTYQWVLQGVSGLGVRRFS